MLKAVKSTKKAATEQIDIPMQSVSTDIWDKKYRLRTKSGEAVDADMQASYMRVARALADVETTPEAKEEWFEKFEWALRRG